MSRIPFVPILLSGLLGACASGSSGLDVDDMERLAREMMEVPPEVREARVEPPRIHTHRLFHPGTEVLQREWTIQLFPDGEIRRHGVERRWYPSGALRSRRGYRSGKPVGEWESWYEGGQRESSVVFHAQDLRRTMTWWHPGGEVAARGPSKAGVRFGSWSYWDEEGRLTEKGTYHEGLRHGWWIFFYADGSPREEGEYERGRRVGDWKFWDEEGVATVRRDGTVPR